MKTEFTDKQILWVKTGTAAVLVLLAAVLRILPHPWNFTPIGAMALFSGSVFKERWLRFMFPLLALFAGDAIVGFHKLIFVVYLSFLINVAIGMWLGENRGPLRIGVATLIGAIQFLSSRISQSGRRLQRIQKPWLAWQCVISPAFHFSGTPWQAT